MDGFAYPHSNLGTIIIPILKMRKLRLSERLAQDHQASQWQNRIQTQALCLQADALN